MQLQKYEKSRAIAKVHRTFFIFHSPQLHFSYTHDSQQSHRKRTAYLFLISRVWEGE